MQNEKVQKKKYGPNYFYFCSQNCLNQFKNNSLFRCQKCRDTFWNKQIGEKNGCCPLCSEKETPYTPPKPKKPKNNDKIPHPTYGKCPGEYCSGNKESSNWSQHPRSGKWYCQTCWDQMDHGEGPKRDDDRTPPPGPEETPKPEFDIGKLRVKYRTELKSLVNFALLTEKEEKKFMDAINRSLSEIELKKVIEDAKTLIAEKQRDKGDGNKDYEKLQAEIENAILEIETELDKEPKIPEKNDFWRNYLRNSSSLDDLKARKQELLTEIKQIRREHEEPNSPNPPQDNLVEFKKSVIIKIKKALRENSVSSDELSHQNWEAQINQTSSKEAISEIQNKILAQIAEIKNRKDKESEKEILKELVQQAKENWNNYENLAGKLKEIKDYSSSEFYQEIEAEVQAIEKRLKELNPSEYQNTNTEVLDQQIENEGLNENNTSEETKKAVEEAKKNPTPENNKKAQESIHQNGAENKLNDYLNEVEKRLEKGDLKDSEKSQILVEMLAFLHQNKYTEAAYKKMKDKADNLMNQLQGKVKDNSQKNNSTDKKPSRLSGGLVALIGVSVVGIVVCGTLLIRRRKLRRRRW
jgi:hypothetical protein